MKKYIKIGIVLTIAVLIIWAGIYYFQQLRGIWPAVLPPDGKIAELPAEPKDDSEMDSNKAWPEGTVNYGPLTVPAGLGLNLFAENLEDPRDLFVDSSGILLVSIPSQGRVVALPDIDDSGRADEVIDVLKGLNRPHGLAEYCDDNSCYLYVAETDGVSRYDYDSASQQATGRQFLFPLPGGGRHWTRSLLIATIDGSEKLFTSVGSSCNACVEDDWRRATVLISDLDGGNLEIFADGLRNAVFLTEHPVTDEVWVTEMGRDLLGDNTPPDEINILRQGRNYGWPYCYGQRIHDSDFDGRQYLRDPCIDTQSSFIDLQAHSAPLGLDFFIGEAWPKMWRHDLLVAYHGSWNRTVPTGYKLVKFSFDDKGKLESKEDFITGWLNDDGVSSGRPVDVVITKSGTIFLSDDKAGVIYRFYIK